MRRKEKTFIVEIDDFDGLEEVIYKACKPTKSLVKDKKKNNLSHF